MQTHNHPSPAAPNSVVDAITKGGTDLATCGRPRIAQGCRYPVDGGARRAHAGEGPVGGQAGYAHPIPISLERLRQPPPDGLEAAIEHAVPQVPFFWNGVEHDPADIRQFKGKAIAYIPTRTASGETKLHILDDVPLVAAGSSPVTSTR